MKRFYAMILCLSLLFSQPLVKVGAEATSTNTSTDTSLSVPSPTLPPPLSDVYDWNNKDMRREADIFTYQILDESKKEAAIIRVNKAVKDLTVPSELDGYKIIGIGQMAMKGSNIIEFDIDVKVSDLLEDTLETLTVSKGIQYIGYSAFSDCKKLTSVKLPSDLDHIADYAFTRCISLKKIYIPESSYKRDYCYGVDICEHAFSYCHIERLIFETQKFRSFYRSSIGDLVLPKSKCREYIIEMNKTTINQLHVDPSVQSVYFYREDEYQDGQNGTIEKIVVNGKKTKLHKPDSGISFGTLYTVPKAKSISWAKKYKHTYKVKSCGKMGKVTRKKQKATWKPVKTTVKTYNYKKQKKKWKTKSRNVKTYYKVYGKNSKKKSYKLIKTTTKTSCKTKYKYLKVQPVATWK